MKQVSYDAVLVAASNIFNTLNVEKEKGDRCGEEVTLETAISIVTNTCTHEEIDIVNVTSEPFNGGPRHGSG